MTGVKLENFEAVVFDLDDTLFDEKTYLFEAYRQIGDLLAARTGSPASEIFTFLKESFLLSGRQNLFDRVLAKYYLGSDTKGEMLTILRTLRPSHPLTLYPQAKIYLEKLRADEKKIFILTNGNPDQQLNKISLLAWPFEWPPRSIYLANLLIPKPSSVGLVKILEDHGLRRDTVVFIGDSEVDRETAQNARVRFYHVSNVFTR